MVLIFLREFFLLLIFAVLHQESHISECERISRTRPFGRLLSLPYDRVD